MRWFLLYLVFISIGGVIAGGNTNTSKQCQVNQPANRGLLSASFKFIMKATKKIVKATKKLIKTGKRLAKQVAKGGKQIIKETKQLYNKFGKPIVKAVRKAKKVVDTVQEVKEVIEEFTELIAAITTPECQDCNSVRIPGQLTVPTQLMQGTGCRCDVAKRDRTECACCFKVGKLDFRICFSAALASDEGELYLLVTAENIILYSTVVKLDPWTPSLMNIVEKCIDIGPPIVFTTACVKLTFEKPSRATDDNWVLCVELYIGIMGMKTFSTMPPCVKIKSQKSKNPMLLEGQEHPTEGVQNMAEADVLDDNYNPMVCLTNAGRKGQANYNYKTIAPKLKRVFKKLNWGLSKLGATRFLTVLHEAKFPKQVREDRLLEKFSYIKDTVDQAEQWVENPGKNTMERTCEGALLSPNKVLTICGCMRSFYHMHVLKKPLPPRRRAAFPDFDIPATDIFLEFSGITYSGGESYRLERDDESFMDFLSKSKCAQTLTSRKRRSARRGGTSEVLTVMKFGPEIKQSDPSQFVQWPPPVVKNPKEEVHMVGFGLEPMDDSWSFQEESGKTIDLYKSSVDFYLKSCSRTKDSKKKYSHLKGATTFCPQTRSRQLCGGKIGHPLVLGGNSSQLIGLSVSAPDCDSVGTTMALLFTEETIREIHHMKQAGKKLAAQLVTSLPWIHAWLTFWL